MQDPFSLLIPGLIPDTYTLSFRLAEAAGAATNTAAGIDSVSITGVANPIPETGTLLLLGAGLLGLGLPQVCRRGV